ncbi:MAG: hypothetical protein E7470_05065 [Ruminococcaceae bacterium]|nr:hypothetical protein [Oscillospiraceae bacterium]
MDNKHADQGYRKLWKTLKDMTWKQRWEHLIYYYGVFALVAIAVIIMGVSLIVDMTSEKPEYLFEGMLVNVGWTDEVEERMTTDLFDLLGGTDPEKQYVLVNHFALKEYSASIIENMYTRVAVGEIDYILVDKFAMDAMAPWGFFTNLNLILSPETMKQWEAYFVYAHDEMTEEIYPIAIDLSKTEFAKQCRYTGDHLYIGFAGNTNRPMKPEDFLQYLMSLFDGE